jgi:ABC-type transporter Mla subunit MlaD
LARGGLVLSQNESRLLQASLDLTISENSRLSGRVARAGKYVEDLEGKLGLARGGLARSQNESRLLQTSLDLTISENSRLSRRLVERDAGFNKIRSQLEQIEQALAAAVDETRKKNQAKTKKLNTLLAAMSSRTDAAKRLLAEVKQSLSASTEDNGVVERATADAMCSTDALLAHTITL